MTSKNFADASSQVRLAARACFRQFKPADLIFVACSGGADSLALAKAASLEAEQASVTVGAVVIDHGWAQDSSENCEKTAQTLREFGLAPVLVERLPAHERNELLARTLRYQSFAELADRFSAKAVLLAHTKNDQAETVLMRLARGSGATSLAGIPPQRDIYYRPLLGVDRATTEAACTHWGLTPWQDPANEDLAYARVRVRNQALPALIQALGPSVVDGLARSASLLRDDANVLDSQSRQVFEAFFDSATKTLDAEKLAQEPPAITRRVLLNWVKEVSPKPDAIDSFHLAQLELLLSDAVTTRRVALPGNFVAYRQAHTLYCEKG